MSLPQPVPGLVIRYAYLWADEHQRGQAEGRKDRPSAVILVTADEHGDRIVTVLPVTHSPPANPALAVEIPHATKRRLGLDDARSWVVLTEANRFAWPGPDVRCAQAGDVASVAYGELPGALLKEIKAKLVQALTARRVRVVPRTQ